MKKVFLTIFFSLVIGSICFAESTKQPSNKSPKFQKQIDQLKNKIAKYESKTEYYQKTAAKYQNKNKADLAKAYSSLADANSKLVNGLKTIYASKKSFIEDQQKVIDVGTAFTGKEEGNAAMFPHKNTTIDNRIKALNKCIEMYDKQGDLASKDGAHTQGVDYDALGKTLKEQTVGLETVASAQEEIKKIRAKIKSFKKSNKKATSK